MAQTGNAPDDDGSMERLKPLAGVHEYPSRVKCATLPWYALLAAIDGEGQASSE
jgi:nitrogen fixation NifU-like protein